MQEENPLNIREHEGYHGEFTTDRSEGAWANGTRIVKSKSEPGDATPNGTMGTVLGSIHHPEVGTAYFIEWDDRPKHAVLVCDFKISEVTESP